MKVPVSYLPWKALFPERINFVAEPFEGAYRVISVLRLPNPGLPLQAAINRISKATPTSSVQQGRRSVRLTRHSQDISQSLYGSYRSLGSQHIVGNIKKP